MAKTKIFVSIDHPDAHKLLQEFLSTINAKVDEVRDEPGMKWRITTHGSHVFNVDAKDPFDFSDIPMTEIDRRDYKTVQNKVNRLWRNYWISRMHKHGFWISQIAHRVGLTESTVRSIIKGKK